MGRNSPEINGKFRGFAQKLVYPENIPFNIYVLVSKKIATLYELQTVYGVEDLHDLLEVLAVETYNESLKDDANDN